MSERKKIAEEDDTHKAWMPEAKKQTLETLPAFIKKLTEDYEHDYGTICHAIAAAAIGAAQAVQHSPQGGITGFQAGAVMWEIIKGWGVFGEGPKRMTEFEHLLYPQYEHQFRSITPDTAKWIKKQAQKRLQDTEVASPRVMEHWNKVAEGWIPFGLKIEESV